MKPGPKIALAVTGLGVATLAGFFALENLRGRLALEEAYAKATASGLPEGFDPDATWPDDEGNVFAAPVFRALNEFRIDPDSAKPVMERIVYADPGRIEAFHRMRLPDGAGEYGYYPPLVPRSEAAESADGEHPELVLWAAGFRRSPDYPPADPDLAAARQILQAIDSRLGPKFSAMAEAARRPRAVLRVAEVDLGGCRMSFLPQWNDLQPLRNLLVLRMAAAIEADEAEVFRESFPIYLALFEAMVRSGEDEAQLVVASWIRPISDLVALGIGRDKWDREDLLAIHRRLDAIPLRGAMEFSYSKMADDTKARFEGIRRRRRLARHLFSSPWPPDQIEPRAVLAHFVPGGWIDLNAATAIAWTHEEGRIPWRDCDFRGLRDLEGRLPEFDRIESFLLPERLEPRLGWMQNLVEMQIRFDFTRVACLLEIHLRERGVYPATLEALGRPLPADPFSQAPFRYRREGAGYLLYSVGMNLSDDGGRVVRTSRGRLDPAGGDWVWGTRHGTSPENREGLARALAWLDLEREMGRMLDRAEFERISGGEPAPPPVPDEERRRRIIERERERIRQDQRPQGPR